MKPAGHLAISMAIAGGSYLATGSPTIALATLGAGFLVDSDHLFDYGYYLIYKRKGKQLPTPSQFFNCTYMDEIQKTFLPFHSYELLLPIWGICLAFFSVPLAVWLTAAFLGHLLADQLVYRPHPLSYSLIYRIWKRFDRDTLCQAEKKNEATAITDSYDTDYARRPYELRPPTDVIKDRMIVKVVKNGNSRGDQSLLDIGCGMGHLAGRLAPYGNVTGIDVSPEAIKVARQKSVGVFLQGDAQTLAFPDASFDCVIAKDVLEHVPDDELALREISRVSKGRARIIMYLPGELTGFNLSTESLVKKLTGYTIDPEVGHLRRYTVAQARQMLKAHGFTPLKTWYVVHFSLGIMALLTVQGFRTLKKRDKTSWLTGKSNQFLIKSVFKIFELLGEAETFFLRGLPGAGFFIIAEVKK